MKNYYYDRLYATKDGITSDRECVRAHQLYNRKITIRKQRIILTCVFLMIVIFSLLSISGKVYADSSIDENVKKYKSILIYAGDTLESIALENISDEYESTTKYIKEVASINHISVDSKLVPGNHIIVPYYAERENSIYNSTESIAMNPVITVSVAQ